MRDSCSIHAQKKHHIKDVQANDPWSVLKIVSDFVDGFDLLKDLGPSVTFFGSARVKPENPYYEKARDLAFLYARNGFNVVTGGSAGIMEAANKGAFEQGCVESVGLNINLPHEQKINPYTTMNKTFDYFFARKVMLIKYSYAYVIFPGGFGTMDELFEALTLVQTKKIFPIAIFLVGVDFWTPLMEFIKTRLVPEGMIAPCDVELFDVTDDLDFIITRTQEKIAYKLHELEKENMTHTILYNSLKDFVQVDDNEEEA